jgi:hypothetical protein
MINFHKLTAAAFLSMGTALSGAAFADNADITCADFHTMDPDAQMAMAMEQGPDGGLDMAQDEARGDDGSQDGASVESISSDNVEANSDSGQEGQHDMARGDENLAAMVEYCKGGDELMMKDMPKAPGDGMGQ